MMQALFHLYAQDRASPLKNSGSRESEARSFLETLREPRNGPPGESPRIKSSPKADFYNSLLGVQRPTGIGYNPSGEVS